MLNKNTGRSEIYYKLQIWVSTQRNISEQRSFNIFTKSYHAQEEKTCQTRRWRTYSPPNGRQQCLNLENSFSTFFSFRKLSQMKQFLLIFFPGLKQQSTTTTKKTNACLFFFHSGRSKSIHQQGIFISGKTDKGQLDKQTSAHRLASRPTLLSRSHSSHPCSFSTWM